MTIILLAALACLAVVLLSRPGNRRRERRRMRTGAPGFRYRGVSVRAGPDCCGAVRQYENRRFLQDAVPLLPLARCNAERCQCTYEHHEDRRSQTDRRELQELALGLHQRVDGPEHRHNRGRRRLDYAH